MMNVFRITRCSFINDLSGLGASLNGGRWNSEGVYALYTASTASLALLETLAHLKVLPQSGFCIACIEIPEKMILSFDEQRLPSDWNIFPAPVALQGIGDVFLKEQKYLGLQLPSALLPEDKVILLNPKHSMFKEVKILYSRPMDIDKRLYHTR
jgi:RES domain-containing protein